MQSDKLNTISSFASIAFSSVALIMGLLLPLLVKLLPEEIGFASFYNSIALYPHFCHSRHTLKRARFHKRTKITPS